MGRIKRGRKRRKEEGRRRERRNERKRQTISSPQSETGQDLSVWSVGDCLVCFWVEHNTGAPMGKHLLPEMTCIISLFF